MSVQKVFIVHSSKGNIMREPTANKRICVVIPTLNEEKTINTVVRGFSELADHFPLSILVVDGHSSDNTLKFARKAGASVIVQSKRGKGAAMIEAISKTKNDVYVFIDGDGTYLPSELEQIVSSVLNDKADMVIGSRFKGKTEKGSIAPINILGNKFFNLITGLVFNVHTSDIFSGYRAVKKEVLEKINLRSCHFEVEAEMTVKTIAKGFKVSEVPITYLRRRENSTKLRPFKDGLCIFKTFLIEILREKFPLCKGVS